MTIRPIISVKYNNNYNNLSFEAKKKNKNHHDTPRSAGFMKSIPLAAIIAMSPMNSAQAQNNQYAPEEKIVLQQEYNDGKEKFKIHYVSTDGDDSNAEKLKLSHQETNTLTKYINRKPTECQQTEYSTITIDGFKIEYLTTTYGEQKLSTDTTYNVTGSNSAIYSAVTPINDPDKIIDKPYRYESKDAFQPIPKELFDYLWQITAGELPLTKEHSTIDIKQN